MNVRLLHWSLDDVVGTAEKAYGKMTGDTERVQKGQERQVSFFPSSSHARMADRRIVIVWPRFLKEKRDEQGQLVSNICTISILFT